MPGHLRAALLIGQVIRWVPGEKGIDNLLGCLPSAYEKICETLRGIKLDQPDKNEVGKAIDEYAMLGEKEKEDWLRYIS